MVPYHYAKSIKMLGSQEAQVPYLNLKNSLILFAPFSVFYFVFSLSVSEAHRKPTTGSDFKKFFLIPLYTISVLIVCLLIPKFMYHVLLIEICSSFQLSSTTRML
jgi:hypothetical protein